MMLIFVAPVNLAPECVGRVPHDQNFCECIYDLSHNKKLSTSIFAPYYNYFVFFFSLNS